MRRPGRVRARVCVSRGVYVCVWSSVCEYVCLAVRSVCVSVREERLCVFTYRVYFYAYECVYVYLYAISSAYKCIFMSRHVLV